MRLAVSMYLVIATAGGPTVCCCAPGRAAAVLSRVLPVGQTDTLPATTPMCCGKGHLTGPARKPAPPEKHCPCQEQGGSDKKAVQSTESRVEPPTPRSIPDTLPAFWVLLSGMIPALGGNPVTAAPLSSSSSASPRAPHVLRC